MEFKNGKCKALHLWRNKPRHWYIPGAAQLESRLEKTLHLLVDTKLNMSQHCTLVENKLCATLVHIRQSTTRRSRHAILCLL